MLKRSIEYIGKSSLLKFGITGVLNTIVGLGSIYALMWFFHVADIPANVVGYIVGIAFSLVVNSRWTFQSRESLLSIAPRYFTVILIAYLANLVCVKIAIDLLRVNSYLAQAVGVVPYTVITYIASRCWVFRYSTVTKR